MSSRRARRWHELDHSDELLLEHVVGARYSQTRGPIPEFLAKKAAEREPKTAEWYRDSLLQLWAFLEARGLTTVGHFDEQAVNLFRVHLRARQLSENTLSNRLRAIKAFARWMAEKGWTQEHVLKDLRVPQSTKPRFDLISDQSRQQLLQLFSPYTYLGSRNLAIIALLSDTGLRREEVVNLLLKHLDLDSQVLKVYSDKSEEWRYVPLTNEVVAVLRNHLKWRERFFGQPARQRRGAARGHSTGSQRQIQSDRCFLSCNGEALTPHGLAQVFIRASRKLGMRFHPHLFRHDWITRRALDGENPSVVKRWAGHKSYAMTDYYFGVAEELLGAIRPKSSVLSSMALPGIRRRGRPPKTAAR